MTYAVTSKHQNIVFILVDGVML